MAQKKGKSLLMNSIFNTVYNILNLLFPLITSMYVARILKPSGVGMVAYAQNIVSYFILFACMGLPTYGLREIAKSGDDINKRNKIFTELFCVNIITTGLSSILFLVFVFSNSGSLDIKLVLCCGLQLFLNFINIDWVYSGVEEYVYIVCRSIVIKVISIIAIFLFVKQESDYIIYALISSIALAGNYLFNVFNVKQYVHFDFHDINLKKHFKPLLILGIALILSSIYSKLDITMLGVMKNDQEVGLYSNAFKLVQIVTTLAASITAVFLPKLSFYYMDNKSDFYEVLNKGVSILAFFVFPLTAGLFVLAPIGVFLVFGSEFAGAASTVRVLSALILIKGFGDLLCYQLSIATGNEKKRIPAYFCAALMNLILNYFMIPLWGRNGAAIASVLSEFVLNLTQFIILKRILKYKLNMKSICIGIISTFIMVLSLYLVLEIDMNILLKTLVTVGVGGIVYIVSNIFFKNEFVMDVLRKIRIKFV